MANQLIRRLKLFAAAVVVSGISVGQAAPLKQNCDIYAKDTVSKSDKEVLVLSRIKIKQLKPKKASVKRQTIQRRYYATIWTLRAPYAGGPDRYVVYLINRDTKAKIKPPGNLFHDRKKAEKFAQGLHKRRLWKNVRDACY